MIRLVLLGSLLLATAPAWAQMDHAAMSTPPRVDVGPLTDSPTAAAMGHHEQFYGAVLVDQLEWRGGSGTNIGAWEGQAYYGGDYDKAWINTRGEYNDRARALERAEVQLLYSHLINYFFNAQAGIRQDIPIRPNQGTPARTHLVLGVQGLLPGLFDVNLQGFVDHRGTVAARAEGSYDAYLTQRLVLQPRIEVDFAANADPQARLGAGLTRLETGLRLRYEITREFAPYLGVQYESVFGDTARYYKRAREDRDILSGVAGIRLFF